MLKDEHCQTNCSNALNGRTGCNNKIKYFYTEARGGSRIFKSEELIPVSIVFLKQGVWGRSPLNL